MGGIGRQHLVPGSYTGQVQREMDRIALLGKSLPVWALDAPFRQGQRLEPRPDLLYPVCYC